MNKTQVKKKNTQATLCALLTWANSVQFTYWPE